MRLFIKIIFLIGITGFGFATNSKVLVDAGRAYSTNNTKKLYHLYSQNKNEPILLYLYAKSILDNNDTEYALYAIRHLPNSYIKNDLLHQLLPALYKQQDYNTFNYIYNQLENTKISDNETCGYDISNIKLNKKEDLNTDKNWLVNNDISSWCSDLGMALYENENLSKSAIYRMLSNLVIYQDLNSFNKISPRFGISSINFNRYKNSKFNRLPKNQYIQINYIVTKAKKDPDTALDYFYQSNLSEQNKTLLANYIAMQFAANQQFKSASNLFDKYYSNNISNDEFEWRTRSYLANNDWNKVISSINNMPETLAKKNTWLYWLSIAYKRKQTTTSINKSNQLLKTIPADYSYYYMLAQGELGNGINFNHPTPKSISLSNDKFADNVEYILYLYQLGKNNNNNIIATIGLYEWYYTIRLAKPNQLLAMSIKTRNQGYYDLSIAAANRLDYRILYLSFPTPYYSLYQKYSRELNINPSFPLAITRQESRFNASVVAFDGGEGLMQIMPYTAKYIAKKSKYGRCSSLNAQCNIHYGTWYLGNLYKKFGSYIYAAAGYNGGPNRANRWQNNLSGLDTRLQIELIPIRITRDYVQKILVNEAIYSAKLNNSYKVNMLDYIQNIKVNTPNPTALNDDNTDASNTNSTK